MAQGFRSGPRQIEFSKFPKVGMLDRRTSYEIIQCMKHSRRRWLLGSARIFEEWTSASILIPDGVYRAQSAVIGTSSSRKDSSIEQWVLISIKETPWTI